MTWLMTNARNKTPVRFGAAARWGASGAALALVLGVIGLSAAAPAGARVEQRTVPATSPGTWTWLGEGTQASWSLPANWVNGDEPGNGAALVFPSLPDCGTGSGGQKATCYNSVNDEGTLDVASLTLDGSSSYYIGGDSIDLNTGTGVTISPAPTSFTAAQTNLALPIALGASQTWTLGDNSGLALTASGGITQATGTDDNLTVDVTGGASLTVTKPAEVGTIAVDGTSSADTGTNADDNGFVGLRNEGTLNATTGNPVDITDAGLSGAGSVGPLTVAGGDVNVGVASANPSAAPGILATQSTTLDSASAVNFLIPGSSGDTPGTNYSQLTASGDVSLGGANLSVTLGSTGNCFSPPLGQTYEFVSSTGTLTGTFGNAPAGDTIPFTEPPGCATPDVLTIAYASDGAVTGTVTLPPRTTSTAVSVSPSSVLYGQSATYSATVTDTSGLGGTPTGSVAFTTVSGGTTVDLCTATLTDGAGSCTTDDAPVGTNLVVTGAYSGSSVFQASSGTAQLTVEEGNSSTSVSASPNPTTFGDTVTYSATVTAAGESSGTPTGTVSFTTDGGAISLCTASLTDGTASCTADNAPIGNPDTITGDYSGDTNFTPSSGTAPLTVNPIPTTTVVAVSPMVSGVGNEVTFSATVTASQGAVTPIGSVAFTTGTGTDTVDLCTATLTNGSGSCQSDGAPLGADTVTGLYSGGGNFASSSGTATLTVVTTLGLPSTTTVSVSPSSVVSASTVTYSAVVSPQTVTASSTDPTGSVTFITGNTFLCTASLSPGSGSSSVASCSSAAAPVGTDSVTGTYTGDQTYASSSGSATLSVTSNTTTTLSVNPSAVLFGNSVQYSVSVSSSVGNSTPSGTVAVSAAGGVSLCTATLSNGSGSCFSSAAPVGSPDTVTASYSGDSSGNEPSTGTATLTVYVSDEGYWMVASDGGIFAFGDAPFYGSTGSIHLNKPVVGMAATPDGRGYWMVASDGGIFAYGDAGFHGSTGNIHLNQPIVGMAPTYDGRGYWLVASDGGIFAFGDAAFYGSMGGKHLNEPIVGMASTPDGRGYWLVASDGGIFSFGDAAFYGSTGSIHLNQPIVGMAPTSDGHGYWLVASDGGIFAFGDAHFYGSTGSIHLNKPVVAMAPTKTGDGYWLVASDGGIFSFGDAQFFGSTGNIHLNEPVVGNAVA